MHTQACTCHAHATLTHTFPSDSLRGAEPQRLRKVQEMNSSAQVHWRSSAHMEIRCSPGGHTGKLHTDHVYTEPDTTLAGTRNPQLEADQTASSAGGGAVATRAGPPSCCADVSGRQATRQAGPLLSGVDWDTGREAPGLRPGGGASRPTGSFHS